MVKKIQRLCVYCGTSPGKHAGYVEAAKKLARSMVSRNIELVFGGSGSGIMGELADSITSAGGKVTGVISGNLVDMGAAHPELSDLRIVESFQKRKQLMMDISDAFLALPGGIGTLDELFEVLVWSQLGMHSKPCGILDTDNYFSGIRQQFDHAINEGFIKEAHRTILIIEDNPEVLLDRLETYEMPKISKWINGKTY
jgi:uncharacterized protein (TIGR00730 family)